MLNELFLVAEALDRLKLAGQEAHQSIKPMGNSPALVARVTDAGSIGSLEILMPEKAGLLKRIEHGSAGTSFPGFNLPSPVWDLADVPLEHLKKLVEVQENRKATVRQRLDVLRLVKPFAKLRALTKEQERQFNRILHDFVPLLASDFAGAPPDLAAFTQLLAVLGKSKLAMAGFIGELVEHSMRGQQDLDVPSAKAVESFLVGQVVFKGIDSLGSVEWWQKKRTEDQKGKTAIFLDLDSPPASVRPVAHQLTCELIEEHLLKVRPGRGYAKGGKGAREQEGVDAFTGEKEELTTSFPEPRVQALRPPDLKLFSASSESPCLGRYGLIDSAIFPASKKSAARMQNAIKSLASKKEQRGKTWYPIPSNLNEKKKPKTDLLVAYLENEPESRAAIAEMFGGQCDSFSAADFEALTGPIFDAIKAKLQTTPDMNIRLLVLSSIDRGRKQISLNRSFRVVDVIRAAKDWQVGARNAPEVSVWFYDKNAKRSLFRTLTTPCPIELASTINQVWRSNSEGGFKADFQRAVSISDAYDIFLADTPLAQQKAEAVLGLLIRRMSLVLAGLGEVKTTREWTRLNDAVRWQSVKAIALFGILLSHLEQHKEHFMKESIYQLGRLLALADNLHFQYCKFVRTSEEKRKAGKVDAPGELLGNSLFNFALDQPVSALARLAERIKPYKGWADTYGDEDSGLVHWFVRQMSETEKGLEVNQIPSRMADSDKAKLLLGYLADLKNAESQNK
jgi:hypothetical protein